LSKNRRRLTSAYVKPFSGDNMWKPVMIAMAALAVGGSSIVYAQQRDSGRDGNVQFKHHRRVSPEERAAFIDARIAALKAGLELTPDQAKNWPAFEQALRDMAQLRAQLRAAREARKLNPQPITPFERMSRRADNMAKRSAALKRIAEAGTPLYQNLNDAQKARFKKLSRVLRPHHHHLHVWNEDRPRPTGPRSGRG
jgi:zinc resistance-associated protein